MKFGKWIQNKIVAIIILLFALITIFIFLLPYSIPKPILTYIWISVLLAYIIGILLEYYQKKTFYQDIEEKLQELQEKYLIVELIKEPNFLEGRLLKEILEKTNKSMLEHVNSYKYNQEEYKEYIELWIHEIKIPIATSKMVIENNKNAITKSIDEELEKVENYIEQALFYARSNTVEKDYYIKRSNLKEIVNESIKKNKNLLIQEKIAINIHDLDLEVNTDSKWIVFILNQIIQNSVKYRKQEDNSEIEIYSKQGKENVILYVKDNGIGIKKGEITKVFDKGFTGTNGRLSNKKSTGIGLYLCKKLCDKLGIAIELNSVWKEGTEIRIVFPQSSYTNIK